MDKFETAFVEAVATAAKDGDETTVNVLESLCETYCMVHPRKAEAFATAAAEAMMKAVTG